MGINFEEETGGDIGGEFDRPARSATLSSMPTTTTEEEIDELITGIGFATERDRVAMFNRLRDAAIGEMRDKARMDWLEENADGCDIVRDAGRGKWVNLHLTGRGITVRGETLRAAIDLIA